MLFEIAVVGGKFTFFALLYFVFEGNFPSISHRGAYIWRGDLTEGFSRYRFWGLIFGGAYFRNFTVFNKKCSGSSQLSMQCLSKKNKNTLPSRTL